MDDKEKTINKLKDEFQRWEALLARIPEAEGTVPRFDGGWSIKDVLAHLNGWQQLTAARLSAGLHGGEPALFGLRDARQTKAAEGSSVEG